MLPQAGRQLQLWVESNDCHRPSGARQEFRFCGEIQTRQCKKSCGKRDGEERC
jgi:hypothetical protein